MTKLFCFTKPVKYDTFILADVKRAGTRDCGENSKIGIPSARCHPQTTIHANRGYKATQLVSL